MKKIISLLLLCMAILPMSAQKRKLELSIYGGTQSYTKFGNAYKYTFQTGFGFGAQSKYYLSNRVFWATDLYGGTDGGSDLILTGLPGVGFRYIGMQRRDYSITTGVGFNYVSTKLLDCYLQMNLGVGIVDGYYHDVLPPDYGAVTISLLKPSYMIAPSTGIDFKIADKWKLGLGYTFRYLGDVDGSHSVFARVTYVLK
ncbi:hypothetical protein [Porphyromonas sp.]